MAEGTQAELELLIASLHTGPEGADVTRVDVEWQPAVDRWKGFRVRWLGFL